MHAGRTVNIAEFADFDLAPERHSRVLHSILLYGLVGLLVAAPLMFGAVEDWSIFVLQAAAALLGVIWMAQQARLGRIRIAPSPLYLPMLLFALLVAAQFALRLSAYGYATKQELLLYAAYGALMFVAAQVLASPPALRRFAQVLAIAGFVIALFAIVQDFTSNGRLYWLRTPRYASFIFGPYVNRNHYAGLMEMLAPIGLAVALRQQERGRRALVLFATTIMAASLLMTQSRAGVTAFAAGMLVFGALVFRRNRRHSGTVAAMVIAAIIFLVWLNTTHVFARLQELHDAFRSQVLRDGLRMFRVHPVAGWGLGTFPTVYPEFRSFYTDMFVNQAHNDFLQVLVETGLAGLALTVWFLGAVYRRGVVRAKTWDAQPGGLTQVAALSGISAMLVHSLFDFNLHIPANAALFYVLCVIAASEMTIKKNGTRQNPRAAPIEQSQ